MKFKVPKQLNFMEISRLPQKTTNESMSGKICLITGATSGVGYYGAVTLANAGAEIVMLVRSKDKAERVAKEIEAINGKKTAYFLADFRDLKSVNQALKDIIKEYDFIDILINSAGIHNTKKEYTNDGLEAVFCVNHLSSFMITRDLIPLLKKGHSPRIIQVNSEGHRFGKVVLKDLNWKKRFYTGLRSYGASKTAQLLCTWEFNDLLMNTPITINAMHPGAVRTNIGNNNGWLYRFYINNILWHFLKDPQISGNAIYYLAASSDLSETTGLFFNLTNEEIPADHALDREVGKEVFRISNEMTTSL